MIPMEIVIELERYRDSDTDGYRNSDSNGDSDGYGGGDRYDDNGME